MIRSILLILAIVGNVCILNAQIPQQVTSSATADQILNSGRAVCPPGANPFAGTSTQQLFPNAQSNDVLFLCLGDSMNIIHNQDFDLSGDPQGATQPGISYVFYGCSPTVTGPTWGDILTDPCHIIDPNLFPTPTVTSVQQGVTPDGNAVFFNNGLIQNVFNNDDPIQIFFAPMTFDDFAAFGPENDPNTGEIGPCMNVNTADAFSVVYLNAINADMINVDATGTGCVGEFRVLGGLPEYEGAAEVYNVSIVLQSNPTVSAQIVGGASTHDEMVQFTVTTPGVYEITIEDGVSCGHTFTMDMSGCTSMTHDVSDACGETGMQVCVPVIAQNFVMGTSFQYTIEFDETVLQYANIASGELAAGDITVGPGTITDRITVSWSLNGGGNVTVNDGETLYSICFNVIGLDGTTSDVTINGSLTPIEVTRIINGSQDIVGLNTTPGTVSVSSACNVSVMLMQDSTSCPNDSDGGFTVTASGGSAPYTFFWQRQPAGPIQGPFQILADGGSSTINMLPTGVYNITLSDSSAPDDDFIGSIEVLGPPSLGVSLESIAPTCNGFSDGQVSAVVTIEGVVVSPPPPTITFEWENFPGFTNDTLFNVPFGNYGVTITDGSGCTASASETLSQPGAINSNLVKTDQSCTTTDCDGTATVMPTGGSNMGYVINWSTGDTGNGVIELCPDMYSVTVTDSNGCVDSVDFEILAPITPDIVSFDSISVNCPNDMNGSLTVNVLPGNAPIDTYTWDPNVGNTATVSGLGAGTYMVTVTDQLGCIDTATATLFAPPPLTLDSLTFNRPSCPGDSDGSVTAFVSGGATPYTFQWSNGTTSSFAVLPGLLGGQDYSVTVIDANNCDTVSGTIFLEDPPTIGVVFSDLQSTRCSDSCDGAATATAFGGTAGTGLYNFNWVTGETDLNALSSTATQLCAGVQMIEVNDGECSVMATVSVPSPDPLLLDLDNSGSTPVTCNGGNDGTAFVAGTGGTPGYTYLWETGETTSSISGLMADSFRVTVTDANMCTFVSSITVTEPDPLVLLIDTLNSNDVLCAGESTGQITVVPVGGNGGPFTYTWSDGVSSTAVANNLPVGIYTVTVTDQFGCTAETVYGINEPPPIQFDIAPVVEPLCFGQLTTVAIDTAFGGSGGPYKFSVNNGALRFVNQFQEILGGQEHLISIFDGQNCRVDTTIFVGQPPEIIVSFDGDTEIELGDSTEITGVITPPLFTILDFNWTPVEDIQFCLEPDCSEISVAPLSTTTYNLIVTDVNGCTGEASVTIDVDRNRNVYIPNIFTPNNDGFNDNFQPFIGAGVEQVNFMRVFNRWGDLLFERNNFIPGPVGNEGWDGTAGGKRLDPGVFVYLIEVRFVDGLELLYRGDITLMK